MRWSEKARLHRLLFLSGLPIDALNAVRKHVSAVKGGGLLRIAAPRPVWTLALSDVVGDDLATIGSGPAVGASNETLRTRAAGPGSMRSKPASCARTWLMFSTGTKRISVSGGL